jgi:transcriptional regulator with XRE-family HTH domain
MEDFVEWLNAELESRGWSRSEAARRGGISESMFSKVIGGHTRPGIEFCRGLARAFAIPLDEVFRRAGLLPTRGAEGQEELLHYYEGMSSQDRQRLLAIARTFYDAAAARWSRANQPPTLQDLLRFLDTLSEEELASVAEAIAQRRRAT